MDKDITRVFLEILGISVFWADSHSSCSPPFFACVRAWGVKLSYFKDATENQGREEVLQG